MTVGMTRGTGGLNPLPQQHPEEVTEGKFENRDVKQIVPPEESARSDLTARQYGEASLVCASIFLLSLAVFSVLAIVFSPFFLSCPMGVISVLSLAGAQHFAGLAAEERARLERPWL